MFSAFESQRSNILITMIDITQYTQIRSNPLHIFFSLLFLLTLIHSPVKTYAALSSSLDQEEPVTAIPLVGFDPEMPSRRSYTWVPITVELTNNQSEIEGELIIGLKDGNVLYRTPINLPEKTKKAYSLLAFIPGDLDELEFYIETGRWRIPVETVTVTAMKMETHRFIAVISPERGTHDHFAHRPEDESDLFRRVIYTSPNVLPRYWIGYQNIDALIWDGGTNGELTEEQESALDKWIQMGGTLVLASGQNWQELDASPFQNYVPMTLTGSRVLEQGTELVSVGEQIRPILNSGCVIATGSVIDDPLIEVRMKAGDDPFLIERKWGAGRIVFVASNINQPLFMDQDQESIFKDYLTKSPTPLSTSALNQMDTPISSFLRWISQAELPSTWFIAFYLICYIIIVVPINYIVFRKFKRLEWAWFTVPVWALIFAYGAYYIGALRQQGSVSVNEVSIIESRPSAKIGQTLTFCSIYSPVRQWYTLLFDSPPAFPQLPTVFDYRRGTETASDESLNVLYTSAGPMVEDYLIYHWSQRVFKAVHETPIGDGVDIDLNWEGEILQGTITNKTGLRLNNLQLFLKERSLNIFNLEEGKTVNIHENVNTMQMFNVDQVIQNLQRRQFNVYQPRQRLEGGNLLRDSLGANYAASLFEESSNKNIAVLTAFVDQHSLEFELNDRDVNPEGSTLLCVIFPLRQTLKGEKLIDTHLWKPDSDAPQGWGKGRMYGMGGMGYGMARQGNMAPMHFVQNKLESTWDLVSDIPLAGSKIEWLRIEMDYEKLQLMSTQNQSRPGRIPQSQQMVSGSSSFLYNQESGHPPIEDYELHVQEQSTSQFYPLTAITTEDGYIQNPDHFVNKITGKISFRLKAPPKWSLYVPYNAISIQLQVNYGSEDGHTFLGRPL